jgi:hypothetical protein
MDISLAVQRILALEERLPFEEIRQRAMDKRAAAFGSGLGALLQRPKPEDVSLVASQRRVDPFWYVACTAVYDYQRTREYSVPPSSAEVQEVTIGGTTYSVRDSGKGRAFRLPVGEHCHEEFSDALFVDGTTGQPVPEGPSLAQGPRTEVADPADLAKDETIVVPPEQRASYVVRQLLQKMMKPVQADVVEREALTLDTTDLIYRPVWAFEVHWRPKDKRGVVEIDGITGSVRQGAGLMSGLPRLVTRDALFDIGADTVGLLVPGGSIAVKVARAALDKSY